MRPAGPHNRRGCCNLLSIQSLQIVRRPLGLWEGMSRVSLLKRQSHGALLFRLVWPTAILFAATLAVVFATIMWTSEGANEDAAERRTAQFRT